MKDGYRVVDADAHVIEPDDLWARYFDASLRERAPRHLNRAFAIEVDGVPINTPADWETETSAEQTARRDERISATFRELPQTDHHFTHYGSRRDAFREKEGKESAAPAVTAILDWLSQIGVR